MRLPFPFLVGCERSGTTLLRAMLDAHPDLAVPDESHFLPVLASRADGLEQPDGLDVDALADLLAASRGFRRWGMDVDDVGARLRDEAPRDLAAAVRLLYRVWAERAGKRRFADKTTTYVFSMPTIAALLPEAVFVHLIRDGRNVALSLLDVPWGPQSLEEAAVWWRARVEAARRSGRMLGRRRYLEVRFEDLTSDPETELRRVATFTRLRWDRAMLDYHTVAGVTILSTMPADRQRAHDNLRRPPSSTLRDWRRELDARSQAVFELLAGDLLQALSYERRFASVPVIACPRERRLLLRSRPRQAA